jgi:hypothetical protein
VGSSLPQSSRKLQKKHIMREFKITPENVLDVISILVNYEDKISIKQTHIEGLDYPGYEVRLQDSLPRDIISASPGFWNKVMFVGVGEDIVGAVQDLVNHIQKFFEDSRFKDDLKDYRIEFEMNLASALGLLKRVSREEFLAKHPNFPGGKGEKI